MPKKITKRDMLNWLLAGRKNKTAEVNKCYKYARMYSVELFYNNKDRNGFVTYILPSI